MLAGCPPNKGIIRAATSSTKPPKYFLELTEQTNANGNIKNNTIGRLMTDGYLHFCDNGGLIISQSAKDIVEEGIAEGAVVDVALLTAKGQLLTSDGTQNVVLNPGADGLVLSTNSLDPTGLQWVSAGAASGVVAPTPNTIPLRDGTGQIYSAGLTESGPILAAANDTYDIGSGVSRFKDTYTKRVVTNTVESPSAPMLLKVNGVTKATISNTATTFADQVAAPQMVLGTYGAANSVLMEVDPGTGSLLMKKWNGVSYVLIGQIGI